MRRTIIFACLLLALVSGGWLAFRGPSRSVIVPHTVKVYVVKTGDTLWGIASKNNPNKKDVREVVYAIEQHNGITPLVHTGQSIEIPVD